MNNQVLNTKYDTQRSAEPASEIRDTNDEKGFSLMEVLLAVGILAMGMLFIAGVFPVSIHFTTVASERTIAATVADEAFAKIKLYGAPVGLNDVNQIPYDLLPALVGEYAYPSTPTTNPNTKKYWWAAICRRVGPADVQVTVFVSRKAGTGTVYLGPLGPGAVRPYAYRVPVTLIGNDLQITNPAQKALINDGYTIVDNKTGGIYRVLERYGVNLDFLRLNESWQGGTVNLSVWVIPPPSSAGGGRYPCIAVYQKVIRF
ncbi:MAG: prepilin-type N-terminal cleavage/methylation domain-containing protein [Planctomycetota bacterium]